MTSKSEEVRSYLPGGDWRPPSPAPYSYLLGLYLGDGCIGTSASHSPQLTLTLDAQYSKIIDAAAEAMQTSMPEANVGTCRGAGMIKVYSSHPAWLEAFPQHGPGRKHTRVIELAGWQQALTHVYPQELVRGLIHSDGSRVTNRFQTKLPSGRVAEYSYVRYFFTNYSADIRRIFCDHCDLLGIRWTQSSFKNISIANRESVTTLDSFIGPKC